MVTGQGSRNSKRKENPRQEYVNDFFQQNLMNTENNGLSNNDLSQSNNLQAPQTRRTMQQIKRQEQLRQAYQVDLQNEILRNLHVNNKEKGFMSKKDDYTSNPAFNSHMESSSMMPSQQQIKKENDKSNTEKDENKETLEMLQKDTSSLKLVEDTGSVTSDTKTLMRHLRVLRYALYENYSPQSILNLKYSARFVLLVLLAMTIASFIFSKQKNSQLQSNFYMIQASEQRMQSITTINSDTRACVLMQEEVMNRLRYGND